MTEMTEMTYVITKECPECGRMVTYVGYYIPERPSCVRCNGYVPGIMLQLLPDWPEL